MTTSSEKIQMLDLGKAEGTVLLGRPRGQDLRRKFVIDKYDADPNVVLEIKIPSRIRAITASFIGGLLEESIKSAGSRAKFFERVHFEFEDKSQRKAAIMDAVEREVARVLLPHGSLL